MKTITITANGSSEVVNDQQPLIEFLRSKGVDGDKVVVEYNKEALTPSEVKTRQLSDGDRLEIVHIVAGG